MQHRQVFIPMPKSDSNALKSIASSPTSEGSPLSHTFWKDLAKTLGLSLLFAFGIRSFIAEARYIPTGSMEPTLLVNDHLLVDKISYRLQTPSRGDIVVFNPTDTLKEKGFNQAFIKRVIGLPGDKITIHSGQVFINGIPLEENYVATDHATFVEQCAYLGIETPYSAQTQTIPQLHYFVLGDNRLNSSDGRCWGLVPKRNLIGRAVFRFWPVPRLGLISTANPSSP